MHIFYLYQEIFLSTKRKLAVHHIKNPAMTRFIKKPYITGTYVRKDGIRVKTGMKKSRNPVRGSGFISQAIGSRACGPCLP